MWNTIKYTNIHVIEVPEEKRGKEKIFKEIMVENIPNLLKTTNLYIQEVQQIPQRDPQIDIYSKRAKSQIQGENLESDQKKKKKLATCKKSNKISNLLIRNSGGQKAVG